MADESPVSMPQPRVDEAAVQAALQRLAKAAAPPWLHGEVARRMAQRLPVIRLQPDTVIEWWAFSGASEEVLDAAYPNAQRLRVEPAACLARSTSRQPRAPWWSARRWTGPGVQRIAEADVPPASAQLLWANMMLHAAPRPHAVMEQWHRALSTGGFLMFSCFGPDTVKELRALYRRSGWPAAGPEFIDMHDLGDMLVRAGFADPVMDQEIITLTWPDASRMLAELRGLGGNASPHRARGLKTPRWRERLLHALSMLAGADRRPALSFEIVYGHAFKALPKVAPGGETTVSVGDMRAMVRAGRRR